VRFQKDRSRTATRERKTTKDLYHENHQFMQCWDTFKLSQILGGISLNIYHFQWSQQKREKLAPEERIHSTPL